MKMMFIFSDEAIEPVSIQDGIPPRVGEHVYFSNTRLQPRETSDGGVYPYNFNKVDAVRKWVVDRVDYGVRLNDFVHEYSAEVYLKPFVEKHQDIND